MINKLNIFLILQLIIFTCPSFCLATTWYVRPDGGVPGQCDGMHDAAYPGKGINMPCAFDNSFYVTGWINGRKGRMSSGDTLIIKSGSYKMGYDKKYDGCSTNYMYDCRPRPFPSGTKDNPTKIYGETYDKGCTNPPELWGTSDIGQVLNLQGSDWIEIKCIEVTDHSSCVRVALSDMYCDISYPAEDSGRVGLYATNSDNVVIDNLNVHGMSEYGWYTARLSNWTVTNSKINGNANAGWHADALYPKSANSGNFHLSNMQINWNGCGENYPEKTSPASSDSQQGLYMCVSQDQGGFSDGIGMADTGGNYILEDSEISYNAQDGVDFLHVTKDPPSSLIIRRSRMEGNGGNQLKTGATNVTVENNIIISNCGFIYDRGFAATAAQDNPRIGADHKKGKTKFTGVGLNDAVSSGFYSGNKREVPVWTIEIDSEGDIDTFKWRKGSDDWIEGVKVDTSFINLSEGAQIKWKSLSGHTLGDQWKITLVGYGFSDRCRAGGEPLAIDIAEGSHHKVYNNSIYATNSAWNTIISGKVQGSVCNGTEKIEFVNNIIHGPDALFYNDVQGCEGWVYDEDVIWENNVIYNAACPDSKEKNMCSDPKFVGPLSETEREINLNLQESSPAINTAKKNITFSDNTSDYNNKQRDHLMDIGAIEY